MVRNGNVCVAGCKTRVPLPTGPLSYCGTCFYLWRTLRLEGASHTTDLLSRRAMSRDTLHARVSDVLRRSCVDDAERLIAALDRK